MIQKNQNIYEQHHDDDFVDDPSLSTVNYWVTARRNDRIKNILWALLFIVIAVGIGYVLYIYSNKKADENVYFGSRFTQDEKIISFRQVGRIQSAMPDMEIVLEGLEDTPFLDLPEDKGAPLTPQWTKQVARYIIIAERAVSAEQHEKAIEAYRNAQTIFPKMEGVYAKQGMLFLKLEEYEEATKAFKKALKEKTITGEVVNNLGSAYLAMEDYSNAELCFKRALVLDKQLNSARLNLATVYMKVKRVEEAKQTFETYIKNNANDIKAMQAYATLLMDNTDWKRAIEILFMVQRKAPELAPVYFKLGEALANVERNESAVSVLRRGALLVDPKKALGWLTSERYNKLRGNIEFQKLIGELSSSK